MEKYTFSKEICYSKRLKTRTYLKYALTCSLSVLFSAGLVVGLTMGMVHRNNYSGQGGLETPGLPDLTADLLPKDFYKLSEDEELFTRKTIAESVNQATTVDPAELVAASLIDSEEPDGSIEILPLETTQTALEEESPLYYTVYRLKEGENAGKVAKDFGVTTETILSVNGVTNATRMATGVYLKIPSMSGILYEVGRSGETLESIINTQNKEFKINLDLEMNSVVNGVEPSQSLSVGDTLFIAGGRLSRDKLAEISGDSYKKPLRNAYYISSPYGWRVSPFDSSRRTHHNGIDLACPKGTPIYATAAGTVVTAGWSDIYGNYVIIKHASGYKSLYGHMSSISVRSGQYVDQGTVVGKVGSTGQSTGPHLHFTMYKNDKVINPNEKVYF